MASGQTLYRILFSIIYLGLGFSTFPLVALNLDVTYLLYRNIQ